MKTDTVNFKPILFSTAMVQALLSGSKTQTRRIVKLSNADQTWFNNNEYEMHIEPKNVPKGFQIFWNELTMGVDRWIYFDDISCPYGKPGDILWVRETAAKTVNINSDAEWPSRPHTVPYADSPNEVFIYRADGEWQWLDDDGFMTEKSFWKPSIFMPKEACRIFLKVKSVRVERLCEISEEDAIAEGIEVLGYDEGTVYRDYIHDHSETNDPQLSFETLWYKINGRESWNENPWVWVIEFERIERPEGFC